MPQSTHATLSDDALDQLFRAARSYYAWLNRPVTDDALRQLYDLMKWAPTSANLSPVRLLFLRSDDSKRRLVPSLAPGNVDMIGKPERVGSSEGQGGSAALLPALKVKEFNFTSQSEAV